VHKILHVISDTNIGGAGKILLTFLSNFNREEFDISVVLPKDSLLVPEVEKLSIRAIEIEGISDKSLGFSAIRKLKELFEEEKPKIIHTHAALSARIAAKIIKLKVVHTRHSVFDQPMYKKKFPYKTLVGALNNYLSDSIIAVSPAAKFNLVEIGANQKKTIVVYNGIDGLTHLEEHEMHAMRQKFGISEEDFVCSIIARFEKVKGHEYVLKAAQMLQREDPSVKILIAGSGSEEANIRKMAEDLELDNCIFTGFVSDIREILGITHLQLNASYGTEATSIALLEGLSLGIPAAVSDFGGNPYVINDGVNGLLFESKDYVGLSKAILNIKGNPKEYEHFSKRAKEIFEEKFTSSVMADKIEDLYKKLLEEVELR